MFRPRHYHGCEEDRETQGKMQVETTLQRAYSVKMPEVILRLAHAEYERQHTGQDYERMQERGGLGVLEVVRLLADYVERLGGKPSEPRKKVEVAR